MNVAQFKKGERLLELIKRTEEGLVQLKLLAEKRESDKNDDLYDGQYWLSVSEHDDGSGKNAKLNRSIGNAALLDAIIETLEKQLNGFKKEFEEL